MPEKEVVGEYEGARKTSCQVWMESFWVCFFVPDSFHTHQEALSLIFPASRWRVIFLLCLFRPSEWALLSRAHRGFCLISYSELRNLSDRLHVGVVSKTPSWLWVLRISCRVKQRLESFLVELRTLHLNHCSAGECCSVLVARLCDMSLWPGSKAWVKVQSILKERLTKQPTWTNREWRSARCWKGR